MIDCLIIGFNDSNLEEYVSMVKAMGTDSGAYKDLDLALVHYNGKDYRSMDLLNEFYFADGKKVRKPFHNSDFLWPVVAYLGSYLSKHSLTFDYINLFHLEQDKLKEKLERQDILTIAITTTLYVSPQPILEIMSFIGRYNRSAKVIIGGPYIANQTKMSDLQSTEKLYEFLGADIYVISQEGELALVNTIKSLKQGSDLGRVDNIAYKKGDRYAFTLVSIESNPLEENLVNYSLFPTRDIGEFISTRTAKSCPFACSFCGFPERAGRYTYQNIEMVEKELNNIRDIGTVTTLTFLDDTFNVPKGRFKEILQMMIRNNYGFKWNSFYRSDHGDEETIELMKNAGCEGVFLGVESGSDEMLQKMNKTSRRANYLKAIPSLQAAGISTYASLIIGFPGETAETIQETMDFIEEAKPDFYRAQLWYCDPVTPIYRQREELQIKGGAFNWSHHTMDSRTACEWIDRIFFSIQNSVWLPQLGFEQWSTFYLQRRGMSLDRIKKFLICFSALKKAQMLHPDSDSLPGPLLESLKTSCQFDQSREPDMAPVKALSASRYLAAERYWTEEFKDSIPSVKSNHAMSAAGKNNSQKMWSYVEESAVDVLENRYGQQLREIFLAAYGILISRLTGERNVTIVASMDHNGEEADVPLRLTLSSEAEFDSFLDGVQKKIRLGLEHATFGFYILSNPLRMAHFGLSCPEFNLSCSFRNEETLDEKTLFDDGLNLAREIRESIGLGLNVLRHEGRLAVALSARNEWVESVESLLSHLLTIINDIARAEKVLLNELGIEKNNFDYNFDIKSDEAEVFNF